MFIEEEDQVCQLSCLEVRGGNDLASYAAELPGLTGWVSCQPIRQAQSGGDVYYMSACSQGVLARVVLADVAGHGEAAGAAAARLREALHNHVEHWDQSRLIRHLNEDFLTGASSAQFATAFLASYYSESGELLFTNAGHVPPLWYRAAAKEWTFLHDATPMSKEIVDLPLGMIHGTAYTQTAVELDPGDLVLLYTDGISEAIDSSGTQLGLERLLSLAESLPVESPVAAGKGLIEATARFTAGVPPTDDRTIVVLQRRAQGAGR
jgi:sigma-B regulation protein RsbU (phosphoserine phosphatase)